MHLYEFTITTKQQQKLLLLLKPQQPPPHPQKQDRKCTYNVTLRHVCATIVAAELQ
jgi:hypothetical protein